MDQLLYIIYLVYITLYKIYWLNVKCILDIKLYNSDVQNMCPELNELSRKSPTACRVLAHTTLERLHTESRR